MEKKIENILILVVIVTHLLLLMIIVSIFITLLIKNPNIDSGLLDILTIFSSIIGAIIAVLGTYYFTRKLNEKNLKAQKNQFDSDREINLQGQDKNLIIELIHNKQIQEINIYMFHYNKFKNKIDNLPHEMDLIEETYSIFQDWELISSYMMSKKYTSIFNEVIKYRNKDDKGKKIIKAPKNNKEVNEDIKIENYREEIILLSKKLNELEKKWGKE